MRSKQGALGPPRRADHPEPACMLLVAVDGRCVALASARRAVSRESFRLRWLRLLTKSRAMSLAVISMIGRDALKRKRGCAAALCGVYLLLIAFDKEKLSWQAKEASEGERQQDRQQGANM
jgi:hypothetical protein